MNGRSLTAHATLRMAQRGVGNDDLNLIILVGTEVEGGYLVRGRDCQDAISTLKHLMDRIGRLAGKRVVVEDGHIITAYQSTERKAKTLLRHAERREFAK